jgi:protein TonB
MGNTSAAGSIPTGSGGPAGRTPVGSVPNESVGGNGSGSGDATGGRGGGGDPPPAPVKTPASDPPAPPREEERPKPKKVEVRVCGKSGQRAGKFCADTKEKSFLEGDVPDGRCKQCREPEPEHVNRVAESSEPVCTREVEPEVPDSLREEGVEGSYSVTVSYTVDENGRVTGVSVSRSSGQDALDDAAVRAIRKFRYKPAQQNGQPRAVKMTKRFSFRISG